jgi:hypothetical protein
MTVLTGCVANSVDNDVYIRIRKNDVPASANSPFYKKISRIYPQTPLIQFHKYHLVVLRIKN